MKTRFGARTSAWATTAASLRLSSSATCSRTPAGTPSTRRIRPRSRRAASRRCSIFKRWSVTSRAWRSPTRRCSTKPPPRPKRSRCAATSSRATGPTPCSSRPGAIRKQSPCCAPEPRRSASKSSLAIRTSSTSARRFLPWCCNTRPPTARWPIRAGSSPGRTRTKRSLFSRPTYWRSRRSSRPANSARTSPSAARSVSACQWATAARTRRSSPRETGTSGVCRAGSSACQKTPTAAPPCGWRCKRASSTSAATRPRATFAPRRRCWPTSPRCTPCITAPMGCGRSADASTRKPGPWPPGCGSLAKRWNRSTFLTRSPSRLAKRRTP